MTSYARTIRFYLSYIIRTISINSTTQYWLSYRSYGLEQQKGCIFLRLTTTTTARTVLDFTRPHSYTSHTTRLHDLGGWWDLRGTISMRRLDWWPRTHTSGRIRKLIPSSIDSRQRAQTPSNVLISGKISTRSCSRFHHSCCGRSPPCFEQKRLRTLPH